MATAEPAAPAAVAENPPVPAPAWVGRVALLAAPLAVIWAVAAHAMGLKGFIASVAGGVLLLLFAVTSYTDLRTRSIYNWTTYTAIVWVILLHIASAIVPDDAMIAVAGQPVAFAEFLGCPPARATIVGFVVGFGVLFMIFAVGACGGGDLKLVAAAGCYIGPLRLLEGLVNTYILAGVAVAVYLTWKVGPFTMLVVAARRVLAPLGLEHRFRDRAAELKPYLAMGMPMAPFYSAGFLAAILLRP